MGCRQKYTKRVFEDIGIKLVTTVILLQIMSVNWRIIKRLRKESRVRKDNYRDNDDRLFLKERVCVCVRD